LAWIKSGTAAVLVAVLGGSKVYPSIGVLAWLACDSILKKKIRITDYVVANGAITGIALATSWIISGDTYAVPPISLTSHGLITGRNGEPLGMWLTVISVGSILFGYWKTIGKTSIEQNNRHLGTTEYAAIITEKDQGFDNWTNLSFIIWLTSYCLTTSYDYRLIFIFPLLTKLVAKAADTPLRKGKPSIELIGCAIASAYLYAPIIYMCIESAQESTVANKTWLQASALIASRYGVGALSRVLDIAGLPFLAGVGVAFIMRSGRSYSTDKEI